MNRLNLTTPSEAALHLGVHHKTISRLMRQGRLPGVKVANRWLIDRDSFAVFSGSYVGKKGRPKGWSPTKELKG